MVRNIKLLGAFFSNSLTRDMEFKANFIGMLFVDFVYYGSHFLFFSIIFNYVDSLLEFTKEDVTLFLIITFMMDTVYMLFIAENLGKLNRMIVKGDLDFVLMKPVDPQFFSSFRYINSYALVSIVLLSALLAFAGHSMGKVFPVQHVIFFVYSFILGLTIFYSVDFMIASLAFWFRNFSMSGWLSHEIMKFSMRPDTIYSGILRKTLFTIVPMALVSSVPARTLIYGPQLRYLLTQTIIAACFLIAVRFVWIRGLARYESASS